MTDIFGFERKEEPAPEQDQILSEPIHQFDVELMMDLLSQKTLGALESSRPFPNVMQWGNQPGAIKLEVDTGYRFSIKKLGIDKLGNPRWVNKKMFQLNRNGYGGYEDSVAQEVFETLGDTYISQAHIESPVEEYRDLEPLVRNIYDKIKRTSKCIFFPEGIKKLHDDAYIIKLGVRGQGLEARNQHRIEQNQTLISYDREQGTIRVTNYNLLSPTGGGHEFKISPNDLDVYFFPSQDRDEISEVVAVRMKYY